MGFSPMGETSIFVLMNEGDIVEFYNPVLGYDFNLPSGTYIIFGADMHCLPNPVDFPLNAVPDNELRIEGDATVFFGDVEGTAYIDRKLMEIHIDSSTWDGIGLAERDYILRHEIAHLSFNTETYCDLLAENEMLEMGYNPSQIVTASDYLLRCKAGNIERAEMSNNRMKKHAR